jgi:flagellar L-ring protein precursor FlgH
MNSHHRVLMMMTMLMAAPMAWSQSLYVREPDAAAVARAADEPGVERAKASLISAPPPEPRTILKHDIVHIVVSESTRVKSEHDKNTDKDASISAEVTTFPELLEFLEFRFKAGDDRDLPKVGASADREYDAEGEYERKDSITARIAATVLEVKPNGTILLEARQRIDTDGEIQTMVLSGFCREEDVSAANTVFSYQLADLRLVRQTEGDLRRNADKGIITKIFEAIFAF